MQTVSSDATTRERVVRSVLEHGPSTAVDLAERLELTPAAVRRHLEQLLAEGAVEPREPREPRAGDRRGRGRPAKAFALTEHGRERFVQQYDDLAVQALRFLSDSYGEEGVKAFARNRASFIKDRFIVIAGGDPALTPAQVLARVFSEEGYAASVRPLPLAGALAGQSNGAAVEQLCQQHCPVSHVAAEFPQLCEAETEAISQVLGTHVQRLATIAHGDGVCTTCIPTSARGFEQQPRLHPVRPSTGSVGAHQKKEQVS
ncbi:MAG: helix-turn-helix transcriptional regulator [Nocardioides sp.]